MTRLRKQSLHSAPRKVPTSTHTHSQYTLSSNFTTTSQCSNYRQMYRDDSAAIDQHNGAYLLADVRTMRGLTVSLIVLMSWMTDARWVTRQWQRVVLLWQRANWQVSSAETRAQRSTPDTIDPLFRSIVNQRVCLQTYWITLLIV